MRCYVADALAGLLESRCIVSLVFIYFASCGVQHAWGLLRELVFIEICV